MNIYSHTLSEGYPHATAQRFYSICVNYEQIADFNVRISGFGGSVAECTARACWTCHDLMIAVESSAGVNWLRFVPRDAARIRAPLGI